MISLAIVVSFILLVVLLIGPLTYLMARIGLPKIVIYLFSSLSIVSGLWFMMIGLPVWYIGLLPIYCGYISIKIANKNDKPGSISYQCCYTNFYHIFYSGYVLCLLYSLYRISSKFNVLFYGRNDNLIISIWSSQFQPKYAVCCSFIFRGICRNLLYDEVKRNLAIQKA